MKLAQSKDASTIAWTYFGEGGLGDDDCSASIPSHRFLCCRRIQHSLGIVLRVGSAVAVPLFGLATAKLSTDLCLPGDGSRALRDYLFRGSARPRAGLAACGCRPVGKGAWSNRPGAADLERTVAHLDGDSIAD